MSKKLSVAMLAMLAIVSPAGAQDRGQAPMRALAKALAVLAPRPGAAPRSLAALRALPSGIRWLAKPVQVDRVGTLKVGTLAGADVTVPGPGAVKSLGFDWENPPGHPLGFDPVAAMKQQGFRVRTAICQADGMVSEIWRWYEVTLPGRQSGVFYVHAFDAPMGGSMAIWNISYDLTGKRPSLAEVNADLTEPMYTDRCEQE